MTDLLERVPLFLRNVSDSIVDTAVVRVVVEMFLDALCSVKM